MWYRGGAWASCQIRKIAGCACAGNTESVFSATLILVPWPHFVRPTCEAAIAGKQYMPPQVSDPDMHRGTCLAHVPWCMPGSLTSGFLWSLGWVKRSRPPQRMRNPPFCVSGKRPVLVSKAKWCSIEMKLGSFNWLCLCFNTSFSTWTPHLHITIRVLTL